MASLCILLLLVNVFPGVYLDFEKEGGSQTSYHCCGD